MPFNIIFIFGLDYQSDVFLSSLTTKTTHAFFLSCKAISLISFYMGSA